MSACVQLGLLIAEHILDGVACTPTYLLHTLAPSISLSRFTLEICKLLVVACFISDRGRQLNALVHRVAVKSTPTGGPDIATSGAMRHSLARGIRSFVREKRGL
jgi:hypothetical protein